MSDRSQDTTISQRKERGVRSVIAQARADVNNIEPQSRASLVEPSRPVTPASYDDRIAENSNFSKLTTHNRYGVPNKSNHILKALTQQTRNVYGNTAKVAVSKNSSISKEATSHTIEECQKLKLLIHDLNDTISSIENEFSQLSGMSVSKEQIEKRLHDGLEVIVKEVLKVVSNATSLFLEALPELMSAGQRLYNFSLHWSGAGSTKEKDPNLVVCGFSIRFHLRLLRISGPGPLLKEVVVATKHSLERYYQLQSQSRSRGGEKESVEDTEVTEVGKLLLELLRFTWDRLKKDMQTEVGRATGTLTRSNSRGRVDEDSSVPLFDTEFATLLACCQFSAVILRRFTTSETDRKRLLVLPTVRDIKLGLGTVVKTVRELRLLGSKDPLSDYAAQLLQSVIEVAVELVGAVRNFSLDRAGRICLLEEQIVVQLCLMLKYFKIFPNLLLNCARATAKLSLQDSFRSQINEQPKCIEYLVDVLLLEASQCDAVMQSTVDNAVAWPSWHTWPMLSRVCFTLGNLTTTNDTNRRLIGIEWKAVKPLVTLLQVCSDSLSVLSGKSDDSNDDEGDGVNSQSDDKNDESCLEDANEQSFDAGDPRDGDDSAEVELRDATIKLLRLLANLSIEEAVGLELCTRETFEILLQLLRTSTNAPEQEELLLNTIAACTNVSYYACQHLAVTDAQRPGSSGGREMRVVDKLEQKLVELSVQLTQCLFHENEEVVLETARVLGNLTRRPRVLVSVTHNRTDEALVLLLAHCNAEVVTAVTGTLVNMSADAESKAVLLKSSSALLSSLAHLLRRVSFRDIGLSTLICQVAHVGAYCRD